MLGTFIAHYEITAKLGHGGMGEVYRATDTKLDREVAIKVLPQAVAQDKERLARFEREAKVLAQLNHPNIASVYGFDQHEGIWFLVMECVEAEDLSSMLKKGPIPVDESLEIGKQITEALEAAHEKDIIHRDLKPGNIKVDEEGRVKVLDFGLAKALSDETDLATVSTTDDSPTITADYTKPGTILGTAAYMSPEQARGKHVDKRSDIWAFGCVLYEILTGKKAFQGEDVTETLAAIIKGECNWSLVPESTPPIVQILLRKCLIKDRKRRLQHIDDAKVDIEQANDDSNTSFIRVSNDALSGGAKHGVSLPIVAGLVVIAVTITLIGSWFLKPVALTESSFPSNPSNDSIRSEILPAGDLPLGVSSTIAISPDGQWLAYNVGTLVGGDSRLRLRNLLTGIDKEVAPGPDAYAPFFSPDSSRLGYCRMRSLQYVIVPDGNTIEICSGLSGPFGATWSEDQQIIFAGGGGMVIREVSQSGVGAPKTLFTSDTTTRRFLLPHLIPNSSLVLCNKVTGGLQSEIIAFNTQNGDFRTIIPDAVHPTVLRSGHILYVRKGNLYGSRFDTKLVSLVGTPTLIEQGVSSREEFGFASYAISEKGVLAFQKGGNIEFERDSFVWVDMMGKITPASSARGNYGRYRLSPDGGKIAVILNNGGNEDSPIVLIDLGTGTSDTIHDSQGALQICLWAPDGDHIYFTRLVDDKHCIYRAQLYSTQKSELIYQGDEKMLALDSITPDGKQLILVQVDDGNRDIMKLSAIGDGKLEKLFGEKGHDGMPMVSPDGNWLVYASSVSGPLRIYVTPLEGEFKRIPVSSGYGIWPYWHPKKNLLYFQNGGGGGINEVEYDITSDQFETKSERQILNNAEGLRLREFAMDPEGEKFLLRQKITSESKPSSDHLTLITGLHSLLEQKLGSDSN
jgi:eukaryotic-like serine/threonine-protein kinase